jgi:hypothetical protein
MLNVVGGQHVESQPFVKQKSPLMRRSIMRPGEDHFSDALPLALYFCNVGTVYISLYFELKSC